MPHTHPEPRKPVSLNRWVRGHCSESPVNYGVCPRLQSNKCSTYSKLEPCWVPGVAVFLKGPGYPEAPEASSPSSGLMCMMEWVLFLVWGEGSKDVCWVLAQLRRYFKRAP